MPYRRNHRCPAVKNCSCNFFFVERPQIFNGSAASSDNDHIYVILIQHTYTFYNALFRAFSLHKCRVQNKLYKRISSSGNVHNIPDRSSGRCCHNTDSSCICRNRHLIFRSKHSHLFQLTLKSLKTFIKNTFSIQTDLPCI